MDVKVVLVDEGSTEKYVVTAELPKHSQSYFTACKRISLVGNGDNANPFAADYVETEDWAGLVKRINPKRVVWVAL